MVSLKKIFIQNVLLFAFENWAIMFVKIRVFA